MINFSFILNLIVKLAYFRKFVTTWSLLLELYKYVLERKEFKIKSNLELLYPFMNR